MAAPFTVAQLIVPSDGLTSTGTVYVLPDWARSKIYIVNSNYIRTYTTAKETQSPLNSVALTNVSIYAWPSIDPQTGEILILGNYLGGGPSNCMPIFKVNPTTGTVTDHYGSNSSLGNYPSGVWVPESLVGVICNGVSYAISKEDAFNGTVCAHKSDPLIHAGYDAFLVSNNRNNRANLCAGVSGAAGASAFLIDTNNPGRTSINVYYVRIAPGAELYNPASWPTTNPAITSGVLANIPMTSMDPTYTQIAGGAVGYDQTDGNVIIIVNNVVSSPQRVAKINSTTGAIMWVAPANVHVQNLQWARLADGYLWLPGGNLNVSTLIDTTVGTTTVVPLTGLHFNETTVAVDGANLAVFAGTYYAPGDPSSGANPADPASGTASFSSGYGLLWPTDGPPHPPGPKVAVEAELVFNPTTGFVDFSTEANRRLFVSDNSTPAWMGLNGALPFGGIAPSVYLTRDGVPATFAQNAGRGSSFAINSGPMSEAVPPGCTPYVATESGGPAQDPSWRLSVSDDGGRTWSTLVKPRAIGEIGEYLKRLRWMKLGQSRERMIRLDCTDPVRRNIVGVYLDISQGMR